MAGYKIQLKDKNGNRQYPVSTTDVVVDADGVSVADLLDRKQPTLVSGVNIKTINGKTLLGEGDLVIEGGNGDGSASVETRVLYVYLEGAELTEEEKTYNKETYDKIANGENVQLVFDVLGIPITHAFYDGVLVFTCSVVVIEGSALYGQGNLFSDGNYEYEEGVIGSSSSDESYPIYYSYDGTPLTEEQKAANKMAVDRYAENESIILYPYNSSVGHPFDVVLTLSGGVWETAELTNYIFAYFNDDGTTMHYVKVTVEQDGDVQVEFSAQSPLVLASKKYVDSKVSSGTLGGNVITLYEPTIDGDTDEIVSTDECLAEIENNFGYDIEIPQEIKDAVSAFIISMKEHNTAEYARARELTENGEKVMVMLRGYGYPMILLGIYLIALVETGKPPVTSEEFLSDFNALTSMEEMIFPQRYIAADSIEGEFGIEVAHDRYALQPDENGEWTITSTESVRKYAILYYEGTARLTAQQCETNLKSKGNRLNNCDFQVNRYRGDGWSDNEDVLIIAKTHKTVTDFKNLAGDVVTCAVTAFQYIEDMKLVELQVSNEDGYCRKVVLGQLQFS
jgi:hypothetical protein